MGLFKDFKDDFSQAVNEMMPGADAPESGSNRAMLRKPLRFPAHAATGFCRMVRFSPDTTSNPAEKYFPEKRTP